MLPRVALFLKRSLVGYLVIASFVLGFISAFPAESRAMFLPSNLTASERQEDLAKIQPLLESKIIRQRLTDLGLNQQEVSSRLAQLSDQEIHDVASKIDTLHAGGDVLGTIVVLLVIAILVVVLLQLTGHKVIVTK
ncbi:MAG TPA: PA2779 family protein [Candidatus Manganitrophaceae bacterium]|nr:PA2779 family protein [Candidatus Manganitrophaceae bacterium]